jgi:isoleucyl-tRNA synthetase
MTEAEKPDYSKTVHLPATEFPMKAGLAQREPAQLKAWEAAGSYRELLKLRQGAPKWILHDGPPFANGDIHMGTAMDKILKDIAVRYHAMQGFSAPYVPGWDCHGMPIEYKVLKEWPKNEPKSPLAIRQRCKAEALKWIDRQREEFKRLGGWGSWEDPYLTLDPKF